MFEHLGRFFDLREFRVDEVVNPAHYLLGAFGFHILSDQFWVSAVLQESMTELVNFFICPARSFNVLLVLAVSLFI